MVDELGNFITKTASTQTDPISSSEEEEEENADEEVQYDELK